jgi:uncharacterized membrane protein
VSTVLRTLVGILVMGVVLRFGSWFGALVTGLPVRNPAEWVVSGLAGCMILILGIMLIVVLTVIAHEIGSHIFPSRKENNGVTQAQEVSRDREAGRRHD